MIIKRKNKKPLKIHFKCEIREVIVDNTSYLVFDSIIGYKMKRVKLEDILEIIYN